VGDADVPDSGSATPFGDALSGGRQDPDMNYIA